MRSRIDRPTLTVADIMDPLDMISIIARVRGGAMIFQLFVTFFHFFRLSISEGQEI